MTIFINYVHGCRKSFLDVLKFEVSVDGYGIEIIFSFKSTTVVKNLIRCSFSIFGSLSMVRNASASEIVFRNRRLFECTTPMSNVTL